ncbi:unnamed protein product [Alternaria alternata]
MSTYVYQTLEGPEHIRLIVLHPALSNDAPLRIDFVSSTLEDLEGRYDAISYTWGEPLLTFPLYIDGNGTQVNVTGNLDRALRYLRYGDRERLFWADAACIDQQNPEEKAVQIPLMVQIFRGARTVMAWLDPGGDTTIEQKGMRAVDRLSRISGQNWLSFEWVNHVRPDIDDIFRFFNLPWFKRLWIVQEVVFSLNICLICGGTELAFSRLIAALPYMRYSDFFVGLSAGEQVNWSAIDLMKKLWNIHSLSYHLSDERGVPTKMIDLIDGFGSHRCADPRDRIYAVYSMATNVLPIEHSSRNSRILKKTTKIRMNIDYTLDVRKSYKAFALNCWNSLDSEDRMWEAVLSRQHSPRAVHWPSWVPDWRVAPRGTWKLCSLPYEKDIGLYDSVYTIPHDLHPSGNYPTIEVHKTGILCMKFYHCKHPRDEKLKDLYTVRLKTSKNAREHQIPILSQLMQLSVLLQKPGAVQKSKRLQNSLRRLDNLSSTLQRLGDFDITLRILGIMKSNLRRLDITHFTNLLTHFVKALLPIYWSQDPKIEDKKQDFEKRLAELDQQLADLDQQLVKTTMESSVDSQYNTLQANIQTQDLIGKLDVKLDDMELFCFQDPQTQVYSIGCGNKQLLIGDHILPIEGWHKDSREKGLIMVLIFRRARRKKYQGRPTFRLVGSGYVLDPSVVELQDIQKKHPKGDKKVHAELKAWEEFASCFQEKGILQSLDLV